MAAARACVLPLLAGTLVAPLSRADEGPAFASPDDFDRFTSHYYQSPEPQRVVPSLHYLVRELGLPAEDAPARAGLVAFYAAILRQDSGPAVPSAEETRALALESPELVWEILWFAGSPRARSLLESVEPARTSAKWARWDAQRRTPSPDPMTLAVEDPGALEVLWGSFFATGDPRYVERVIGVLPLARTEHDAQKIRIGASAEASLVANAGRHPKVLEICKSQMASQPKAVRRVLKEVLARVAPPR